MSQRFDASTGGWRQARDSAAAPSRMSPLVLVFGIALAVAGLLTFHTLILSPMIESTAATTSTPTPVPVSSAAPSAATYPAEILQAAAAISTFYAPTATPTPKPMRPTPTPDRVMTCPMDPNVLPNGTVCTGDLPLPTPTVMPTCLSPPTPGLDCEVRHSRIGTPATPIGH